MLTLRVEAGVGRLKLVPITTVTSAIQLIQLSANWLSARQWRELIGSSISSELRSRGCGLMHESL